MRYSNTVDGIVARGDPFPRRQKRDELGFVEREIPVLDEAGALQSRSIFPGDAIELGVDFAGSDFERFEATGGCLGEDAQPAFFRNRRPEDAQQRIVARIGLRPVQQRPLEDDRLPGTKFERDRVSAFKRFGETGEIGRGVETLDMPGYRVAAGNDA